MLDVISGFVAELREVGIPVSVVESLDAADAVMEVSLDDRKVLKHVLGATLVKSSAHRKAFETAFDIYFSQRGELAAGESDVDSGTSPDEDSGETALEPPDSSGALAGQDYVTSLPDALLSALVDWDYAALAALARQAVKRYAGIVSGRPVAGSHYLFRTLRHVDFDGLGQRLEQELIQRGEAHDSFAERLVVDEAAQRMEAFRKQVEAEIRRLLVADRGVRAVAKTARRPLPEDIDFMHATREELVAMRVALKPLTHKLAARISWKRRHGPRGPLDFRDTIRHSLSTGGVPVDPVFRYPRPAKPEIFMLADVSGSVASFSRFTLQLVYAMSSQFSRVRSFVFIDGIDEVTHLLAGTDDIASALARVNAEADVIWLDGHSDYGHAFESFWERFGRQVSQRTSMIILGDARNNYHASGSWVLEEAHRHVKRLYWLNPEPRAYWGSGDSIIEEYVPHCDGAFECRNLRHLERFVKALER